MDETEKCVSCERKTDELNDDGECLECERETLIRKAEYARDMAGDR